MSIHIKKTLEYSIVALCLLPLFFINIRTSHDWGDDFAQYIHQAQNILSGTSQNETGYIFNESCYTAPKAYPTGFPILLAPVIYFFGANFYYLNLYMTLFLALSAFVGFLLLRNYTSYLTALVIALIVAYNPLFLNFKTEVLSDLPFTFFSMLCLLILHKKENLSLSILLGVLMGFSLHIRSAGLALSVCYLLYKFLIENSWRNFSFKTHKNTFVTVIAGLIAYFLIQIIFPCDVNYTSTPQTQSYWEMINDHFSYTLHQLSWMFRGYDSKVYFSIGVLASSCLVVFSLLGLAQSFKDNKKSFLVGYTVIYIAMVVNHRSSHQGLRFMYPIIFLLFLFTFIGFKKAIEPIFKPNRWLTLLIGAIVLFSYHFEILHLQENKLAIVDGPQLAESQEVFNFIDTQIPAGSIVAFDKPRTLALYTKAQSFTFAPDANDEGILNDAKRLKANYILTNATQSTDNLKAFPLKDTAHCQLVYTNKLFNLFRLKGL
jgi:4-amino-4-deoxy-L-arabinose transferase-like glycosyltransferase